MWFCGFFVSEEILDSAVPFKVFDRFSDVLLGIKFSPSERTSSWGVFRILEERLVMYFLRLVCLWVSFWICLRVVFLEFLLAYILGYFRGHEFILRILLLEIFIDKFDVEDTEVGVV